MSSESTGESATAASTVSRAFVAIASSARSQRTAPIASGSRSDSTGDRRDRYASVA